MESFFLFFFQKYLLNKSILIFFGANFFRNQLKKIMESKVVIKNDKSEKLIFKIF
jgi:hypothetical protein